MSLFRRSPKQQAAEGADASSPYRDPPEWSRQQPELVNKFRGDFEEVDVAWVDVTGKVVDAFTYKVTGLPTIGEDGVHVSDLTSSKLQDRISSGIWTVDRMMRTGFANGWIKIGDTLLPWHQLASAKVTAKRPVTVEFLWHRMNGKPE